MSSKLCSNEVTVITGASRGVGERIAHAFASNGAKKLVLIAEQASMDALQQVAEACKSAGAGEVETIACDLADPKAVQGLADRLAGAGATCLVNNAGIFSDSDSLLKGNPDDWERMMKVNALAPMRLIRALAPKMADQGRGTIICIGDVEGWHTGPKHAAYAASKYALHGFAASCYEALRGQGVRVISISAGNVSDTAMAGAKQGGQGALAPEDVAEACLLAYRCSANCVPQEIVLKAVLPEA